MNVSVDIAITTISDGRLKVLLINRGEEPFKECLALPGVLVGEEEGLEEAVRRALSEEAQIKEKIPLEQLHSYGDDISRDPRNRVLSVAYIAFLNYMPDFDMGERVSDIELYDYDEILKTGNKFAFDHRQILIDVREKLRKDARCTDIAYDLVGEKFTLSELQRVYEILTGEEMYKANFRRKIIEQVEDIGEMTSGDAFRPSRLYRKKVTK